MLLMFCILLGFMLLMVSKVQLNSQEFYFYPLSVFPFRYIIGLQVRLQTTSSVARLFSNLSRARVLRSFTKRAELATQKLGSFV